MKYFVVALTLAVAFVCIEECKTVEIGYAVSEDFDQNEIDNEEARQAFKTFTPDWNKIRNDAKRMQDNLEQMKKRFNLNLEEARQAFQTFKPDWNKIRYDAMKMQTSLGQMKKRFNL
uniref:M-zodatoxin-Lt6a/b n=1 Tax=Lachesana tarabaevi TaxID=379576 RepID=LAT61_LACTA|nr:RecName: Full=M-zodatoxin-Lt6a/b; Short=M-ZDTX-Lt6a/b; AltName: Full=Latarcin 6-1; Short=Ltc 6-1; Contains: RecName: Full=M-zodatoxin-Lt6b; Short=M-ZDTX-Lt6b; AltName: Full=Latarcin-6b; Short=Ltc-6b; Contains: RecName: Full=M-zodatoxin-Lt6a; Short=M-ZDTX-Lt6a; AltName: Full=Latarcin-6a; Short=Ltc-6a; Flags: Precursor [Lachesana tarabaevi]CAJ81651.1 latarcin 6-1 precursor, pLtc 6-1 [Lachesana tarabaevi]